MITAFIVATSLLRLGEPSLAAHTPFTIAAPITIRVNAKPGDAVKGTRTFRVLVDTDEIVNQVEFYVNGKLRTTDDSSPYDFELNTLDEKDGSVKLTFTAYTSLSHKASKDLTVNVNNEVSLGADAHVKKASEALTVSDWDTAISEGRIALKATPNYVPARLVLARAFLGKGIIDEALNNAQEAVSAEPNNMDALDLQAGIQLHSVFNTFNTGGDRSDTLKAIREGLTVAVNTRRKLLDARVDAMKLDAANPIPYADVAIKSGRYSAAISALQPVFSADPRRSDVGERLAFAQLRTLRVTDAQQTVSLMNKFGKPDAYSSALTAMVDYQTGNDAGADQALSKASLADPSNLGVRTAQAYIALRRKKNTTLSNIVRDLEKEQGQRSDVDFFLSAYYYRVGDGVSGRRFFERALLAEPTNVDVYIEQANQAIDTAMNGNLTSPDSTGPKPDTKKETAFQLDQAHSYFEVALLARPSSPQALAGLTIVSMLQNSSSEAIGYGEAAMKAGPEYTAGLYAYAGALQKEIQSLQARATKNRQLADQRPKAEGDQLRQESLSMEHRSLDLIRTSQDLLKRAAKLDPNGLGGRQAPTAAEACRYYARYGQTPVMAAP